MHARIITNAPLAIVMLFFVLFDLSVATFVEIESDSFAGFLFGTTFSQMAIIAVFIAMTSFPLFVRIVTGTTATLLASLAVFTCVQREAGEGTIALSITAAMIVQWAIYQIPLWSIRLSGWRLTGELAQDTWKDHGNETQFGIIHLLVWTFLVAGFLAISRIVLAETQWSESTVGDALTLFLLLSATNSVLVLPLIWACLVNRRVIAWIVGSVLWCVLLTRIELFMVALMGVRGIDNIFYIVLTLVQLGGVTLSLLSLRLAGFRLSKTEMADE